MTNQSLNMNKLRYYNMTKRVTIMIDEDNDKKLRMIQAKQITQSTKSVSYSRVINEILRKAISKK